MKSFVEHEIQSKIEYSSPFLDKIEQEIIVSLGKGGDGVGARITNRGVFKIHHISVTEEDNVLLDRALSGL